MYLSCLSGLWWLLSIEFTSHRLSPERVASSLLFFRVLSLLIVYKLSDLSFFLHAWEWDWLGCFSILWCMSMRLLLPFYSPGALLVINKFINGCFAFFTVILTWLRSYPSWLFSARKRRTYFLWNFSMETFSSGGLYSTKGTKGFLFLIKVSPISIFGFASACFAGLFAAAILLLTG